MRSRLAEHPGFRTRAFARLSMCPRAGNPRAGRGAINAQLAGSIPSAWPREVGNPIQSMRSAAFRGRLRTDCERLWSSPLQAFHGARKSSFSLETSTEARKRGPQSSPRNRVRKDSVSIHAASRVRRADPRWVSGQGYGAPPPRSSSRRNCSKLGESEVGSPGSPGWAPWARPLTSAS